MEMMSIKLPTIPQWLGKAAVVTIIGSVIWMVNVYAQSGFITPSFMLERIERNQANLVDLSEKYAELQSRVVTLLEQHEKRLERIERDK